MSKRDTTPRRFAQADRWSAMTPDEKIAAVRPLFRQGWSSGRIAAELSATLDSKISRGAVVGLISRNRSVFGGGARGGNRRSAAPKKSAARSAILKSRSVAADRQPPKPPAATEAPTPHGEVARGGVSGLRTSGSSSSRSDLPSSAPDFCSSRSDLRSSAPDFCSSRSDLPSSAPLDGSRSGLCPSSPLGGVSFFDLTHAMCRFPLWGDGPTPPLADMRFCGAPTQNSKLSWCTEHLAVVAGKENPARADMRKRNGAIRRAFAQGVSVASLAARHDLPQPAIRGILEARAPAAIVGGLGVAFGTLK
ncbi:GcrA family cell cycle regulator [Amorphus sp. 3PC139-8]|uniref:GcrA family cell cycle regulator n=1 Tax=Amorphus sp. 3PC139-8 TaxID=2735676 RepID=UPI00345CAAEA